MYALCCCHDKNIKEIPILVNRQILYTDQYSISVNLVFYVGNAQVCFIIRLFWSLLNISSVHSPLTLNVDTQCTKLTVSLFARLNLLTSYFLVSSNFLDVKLVLFF